MSELRTSFEADPVQFYAALMARFLELEPQLCVYCEGIAAYSGDIEVKLIELNRLLDWFDADTVAVFKDALRWRQRQLCHTRAMQSKAYLN